MPAALPDRRALRVLGIDPGLAATGYALIASAARAITVVASGVIDTDADLPLDARVHRIWEGVDRLLGAHAPELLVLEDLYTESRFPRSALMVAHARGVVCLAARQHDVAVVALAPAEVKRAVAGHGSASKTQVQHGVQRLLGLAVLPRPSHVADALALAITGFSRAGGRLT